MKAIGIFYSIGVDGDSTYYFWEEMDLLALQIAKEVIKLDVIGFRWSVH